MDPENGLIKTGEVFKCVLEFLNADQRAQVFEALKKRIMDPENGLIKTASGFKYVLEFLNADQRTEVFESLKNFLTDPNIGPIKRPEHFQEALCHLKPCQHETFCFLIAGISESEDASNDCNQKLKKVTEQTIASRLKWIVDSEKINIKVRLKFFCDFAFRFFKDEAAPNKNKFKNTDSALFEQIKSSILTICNIAEPKDIDDKKLIEKAGEVLGAHRDSTFTFFTTRSLNSDAYKKHLAHYRHQANGSGPDKDRKHTGYISM